MDSRKRSLHMKFTTRLLLLSCSIQWDISTAYSADETAQRSWSSGFDEVTYDHFCKVQCLTVDELRHQISIQVLSKPELFLAGFLNGSSVYECSQSVQYLHDLLGCLLVVPLTFAFFCSHSPILDALEMPRLQCTQIRWYRQRSISS